eukprot:TRINITY_DN4628_c0_g1_i1.p1 TRINITY_DN4628_c0_g1~~TRINITY_DN4628_c0_g1_i1.p1  ORF type:complete len:479 (+),score=80.25 TRINITY_DN4628_c0_g1_i1:175-1437(+)
MKDLETVRRKQEHISKTMAILNYRITNFPAGQVIPPEREFLLEGSGIITIPKMFNKVPTTLFLFSDLLVVTSFKSTEYITSLHLKRMLYRLGTSINPDTIHQNIGVSEELTIEVVSIDNRVITLLVGNQKDRDRWARAFDSITREYRVFGLGLGFNAKRDKSKLPHFFEDCINLLKQPNAISEEGIFRISAQKVQVESLSRDLDRGAEVELLRLSPHVIASLLKMWLKSLRYPLLLSKDQLVSYKEWMTMSSESAQELIITQIKQKINTSFSEITRAIVKELFCLLSIVHSKEKVNKMSSLNLAVVFSPLLLHPRDEQFQISILRSSSILECLRRIVELMITSYSAIFEDSTPTVCHPTPSPIVPSIILASSASFLSPIERNATSRLTSSPIDSSGMSSPATPPTPNWEKKFSATSPNKV